MIGLITFFGPARSLSSNCDTYFVRVFEKRIVWRKERFFQQRLLVTPELWTCRWKDELADHSAAEIPLAFVVRSHDFEI